MDWVGSLGLAFAITGRLAAIRVALDYDNRGASVTRPAWDANMRAWRLATAA